MTAPAIASQVEGGTGGGTSMSTAGVTASAGDVLCCFVFSESLTQRNVTSITDGSNPLSKIGEQVCTPDSYTDHLEVWTSAPLSAPLSGVSFTILMDGSSDGVSYILHVISPVDSADPVDRHAGNPFGGITPGVVVAYDSVSSDVLAIAAGGGHALGGVGIATNPDWNFADSRLSGAGANWCLIVNYYRQTTSGFSSQTVQFNAGSNSVGLVVLFSNDAFVPPGAALSMVVNQTLADLNGIGKSWVGIAVNGPLVWFWNPLTHQWNDDILSNQNPVGSVGGYDLSGITGALSPMFSGLFGDQATITDPLALRNQPAGYPSWDIASGQPAVWVPATLTNTFFDVQIYPPLYKLVAHRGTLMDLSNGGKTARGNLGGWLSAQLNTSTSDLTGPAYLEIDVDVLDVGKGWIVGLGNGSADLNNYAGADANSAGVQIEGSFYNISAGAGDWEPRSVDAITMAHVADHNDMRVVKTLAPVTSVATATNVNSARVNRTLAPLTLDANIDVITAGVANAKVNKTLATLTQVATGTIPPIPSGMRVIKTLATLTLVATATNPDDIVVDATLADLTQSANVDVITAGLALVRLDQILEDLSPDITATSAAPAEQPFEVIIN